MTTKQIEKLKKQLLQEELRRRRKGPSRSRLLLAGAVLLTVLTVGGLWYRVHNLGDLVEKRWQKGLILREAGDLAAAAELLGEIQAEYPHSSRAAEALLESGRLLHLSLGRYQQALLAYLTLERDYAATPQAAEARLLVADLYKYRLDDQLRAIAVYQKLLDANPADGDRLLYELADAYFRLNNFAQARLEFENLLRSYPHSPLAPEVQFRVAVTFALEGAAEQAIAAYREVSTRWPDSPYALEARFGLATVLEERERLREALATLEALQGIYPHQGALAQRIAHVRERIKVKHAAR